MNKLKQKIRKWFKYDRCLICEEKLTRRYEDIDDNGLPFKYHYYCIKCKKAFTYHELKENRGVDVK
jgi:uncharacterized protein with PIN domain